MNEATKPKAKWYVSIQKRLTEFSEKLALPEDIASEIKVFVFEVAREQYKKGNNSGICWARERAAEGKL